MALVLFGTLDVHWGLWRVQQHYFSAWFAGWPIVEGASFPRFCLPLPGGFTLGLLLIVNLACAHFRYFRPGWRNLGIALIHAGVAVLIVGGFSGAALQEEFHMEIPEGQSRDFIIGTQDNQRHELPFALRLEKFTHEYYPGSSIPKNFSSAVRILEKKGSVDGGRPVNIFMNNPLRYEGYAFYQSSFRIGQGTGDTTILQVVRNPGRLLPYVALYLVGAGLLAQFGLSLTRFLGGFRLRRKQPAADEPGDAAIAEAKVVVPLWRHGLSFALAVLVPLAILLAPAAPAFLGQHGADIFTVGELPVQYNGRLQPVDTMARNILLVLGRKQTVALSKAEAVAFGKKPSTWSEADKKLIAEAGVTLSAEVRTLLEKQPVAVETRLGRSSLSAVPWFFEAAFRPEVAANLRVFRIENDEVRSLLVKRPGAVAYYSWNDLLPAAEIISAKADEAFAKESSKRTSFEHGIVKLASAAMTYDVARSVFAPGDLPANVLPGQEYQAWMNALAPATDAAGQAERTELRNIFIKRYRNMAQEGQVGFIPPRTPDEVRSKHWANLGAALLAAAAGQQLDSPPLVPLYGDLYAAYRAGDTDAMLHIGHALRTAYSAVPDLPASKIFAEVSFNRIEPFFKILCFYAGLFLLVCVAWVSRSRRLLTGARWLVTGAFVLHTLALLARMWIQDRPPVTNLYSSAVFVAWGAVLLGVVIERFLKNGIGVVVASVVGFASLIIAHNLALSGDTLNMMVAVLDDNFWLTTHVVTITFGYSAMFVAGLLGALFLVLRLIKKTDLATQAVLDRAVYGVVCFATLMNFAGTMLGGVWADRSWGRFWGWDPKENGALLIVLWCALFLHARWGNLLGAKGRMQLAVVGSIITAASWFGTNLLGVGLHSYGFTESGLSWLCLFWASQLLVLALGWLPAGKKHEDGKA
ncbi:MAG: cytochrome c biogenesis protein ResB [Puniceicoccales bacterium]|nr:cytochrome c biogenesis protein ResB [Puniceicoccales bacterium]